jgi:hypothetical protein
MSPTDNILVFADTIGPRAAYIIRTLLCDFLGLDVQFASNIQEFEGFAGPKLSWSKEKQSDACHVFNSQMINNSNLSDIVFPDKTHIDNHTFSDDFDVFYFCFLMLTRAEEYKKVQTDDHGRFPIESCSAFQKGLLSIPVVDVMCEALKNHLLKHYPYLKTDESKYRAILTFDIDLAWAYKEKPFLRNIGAMLRDLLTGNMKNLKARLLVQRGKKEDPFHVYEYLKEIIERNSAEAIFFFQMRSGGKYDKAVNVNSKAFHQLVSFISEFAKIGLHPSYGGGQNFSEITREKKVLEEITAMPVLYSRQHFLRIMIPKTPQQLVKAGISNDFTLGFAQQIGWRAGTTKPFPFFDINTNQVLPLMMYPVSVMDGTLKEYLNLSTENAVVKMNEIIDCVKRYNGVFIPLWHNETISNTGKWKGWRELVFEKMIQELYKTTNLKAFD